MFRLKTAILKTAIHGLLVKLNYFSLLLVVQEGFPAEVF